MPVTASAEKADRDKPMHIEADNLVHDELRQVSIFTGRAVLNKGTMVMRGSKIEIREDADGYQYGIILPEPNKRAFFRQKREGVDEFVEGEGQRIDYDKLTLEVWTDGSILPNDSASMSAKKTRALALWAWSATVR